MTTPLEVIGVWLGVAALWGGGAGALVLLRGGSRAEIAESTQYGAACGFILGFLAAVVLVAYLVE